MIRFKKFLHESPLSFNFFVEKVINSNKVDDTEAREYQTPVYEYKGTIYRVIFVERDEIDTFIDLENNKFEERGIIDVITRKMNPNRYVFYTKTLDALLAFISWPNLMKFSQTGVGVVYKKKTPNSIDLGLYNGNDRNVKRRLENTKEVLGFEKLDINNIEGLYVFFNNKWQYIQL